MSVSALESLRQAAPGEDIRKVNVLLVDDDPNVLQLCRTYLADATALAPDGIEVALHTAMRGEQTLRVARELKEAGEPVTVALLDIILPGKADGIEACLELWRVDRETQCILMTGAGAGVEEAIEKRVPADLLPRCDYLGKPFSRFSVVQHVRRAIHAWCAHRREEVRRGENIKLVLRLGALIEEFGSDDEQAEGA